MPARRNRPRKRCRALGVTALATLIVVIGVGGDPDAESQGQTPARNPGPSTSGDSGKAPHARLARGKTDNVTWKRRLPLLHARLHGGSVKGRTQEQKRQASDQAEAEILGIT